MTAVRIATTRLRCRQSTPEDYRSRLGIVCNRTGRDRNETSGQWGQWLERVGSNTAGLPTVYNAQIDESAADLAILLSTHDDVHLCDFHCELPPRLRALP